MWMVFTSALSWRLSVLFSENVEGILETKPPPALTCCPCFDEKHDSRSIFFWPTRAQLHSNPHGLTRMTLVVQIHLCLLGLHTAIWACFNGINWLQPIDFSTPPIVIHSQVESPELKHYGTMASRSNRWNQTILALEVRKTIVQNCNI